MNLSYCYKMGRAVDRLILGAAQFGLSYGITNPSSDQVPFEETENIIRFCKANDIVQLDTAAVYGDSETVLGKLQLSEMLVDTKLPPNNQFTRCCSLRDAVNASLERLNLCSLNTLYFHSSSDLLASDVSVLEDDLEGLKSEGIIRRFGVSIYDPEELGPILDVIKPDVIQVPYNLFDNRIVSSGWAKQLSVLGIDINARSAFLQGVLLDNEEQYHRYAPSWQPYLKLYHDWCAELDLSKLQIALGYFFSCPYLSKVIIGVHSLDHLQQIAGAIETVSSIELDFPDFNAPRNLFDPRTWTKK